MTTPLAPGLLVPAGMTALHLDFDAGVDPGATVLLQGQQPASVAAALGAWRRAVDPAGPDLAPRAPRPSPDPARAYRAARRGHALALLADPAAARHRLPLAPLLTTNAETWSLDAWSAGRSTYARLTVDHAGGVGDAADRPLGPATARVDLGDWDPELGGVGEGTLRVDPQAIPPDELTPGGPRGRAAVLGALVLPVGRVPVDRGGLLGLLGALKRGQRGRSVVVRSEPGRPAVAEVAGRAIPLHARSGPEGPAGAVRVPVGPALPALGPLLPLVEGAELLVGALGSLGGWVVRLAGGVRLVVVVAGWSADGRLGALRVDAAAPPVEAGRFLLNQVVASFRDRPVQSRREVVERTRGNPPAVLAALHRLASLGLVLPEPESDRLGWRGDPAPGADLPDDPEPPEVTAARAITQTESIRVERDELLPDDRGRRVEALILDRPVRLELDADGTLRRGTCTCSHHQSSRLRLGPCRHLLALQARVADGAGLSPPPADLAAWFATIGGGT